MTGIRKTASADSRQPRAESASGPDKKEGKRSNLRIAAIRTRVAPQQCACSAENDESQHHVQHPGIDERTASAPTKLNPNPPRQIGRLKRQSMLPR
jgi:hypothetical protein